MDSSFNNIDGFVFFRYSIPLCRVEYAYVN